MSAMVPPPSTSRKTSASRSVRGEEPADSASRARLWSMARPPAATVRTPSARASTGASLTMKPVAPASRARCRYPGRPNVVTMSTRTPGKRERIACVAVMPSMRGISMSMMATSTGAPLRAGSSADATRASSSRACAPSAACATTSMSRSRSSSPARAPRIIAWSSATSTRIVTSPSCLRLGYQASADQRIISRVCPPLRMSERRVRSRRTVRASTWSPTRPR